MPTETAARMAKKSAKKTTSKSKSKRKKSKKLPTCTKRDLRQQAAYKKNQRLSRRKRKKLQKPRKCRVVKKGSKETSHRPSPAGAVAAPPATSAAPTAFPTPFPQGPARAVTSPTSVAAPYPGLAVYSGDFGQAHAQRLLFRAGFGPRPGQAEALAALGVRGAVSQLLSPGPATLAGPAPSGPYLVGGQLAPYDKWGHLHLQFLDRMVRSTDSLTERMTLVLHDWFGVSRAAVENRLTIDHLELLRSNWRGSFRELLQKVTTDPGMLIFLNGSGSHKRAPNENYARELMELYALGADRGAYTETDVRELARTFTGWRHDWSDAERHHNFRFDPTRFDTGSKTVFAGTAAERRGNLSGADGVNAVVDHPLHPSFVVRKLWSYFVPTEPAAATQAALEALYRSSGERLDRLVEAILLHPDLYAGAAMTKPPAVYAAGLLRSRNLGLTTDAWTWRLQQAGQLLGDPPSVAGWNDRGWINTSTFSARWGMGHQAVSGATATAADYKGKTETPDEAIAAALAFWGNPVLSVDHLALVSAVANKPWNGWKQSGDYGSAASYFNNRQNILRQLIAAGPDAQVC